VLLKLGFLRQVESGVDVAVDVEVDVVVLGPRASFSDLRDSGDIYKSTFEKSCKADEQSLQFGLKTRGDSNLADARFSPPLLLSPSADEQRF